MNTHPTRSRRRRAPQVAGTHVGGRVGRTTSRRERGSAVAEAALVAPLLVLLAVLAVGFGRTATTRQQVDSAARYAARAASRAADPTTALIQARQVARETLAGHDLSCVNLVASVDLANFTPGGTVAVTVRCTVVLSDVAVPGLPGHLTVQARFTSPVDSYRPLDARPR